MILIIRRCVVWSFLITSSVIVRVPETQSSDGVTVASTSLSLPRGGNLGDELAEVFYVPCTATVFSGFGCCVGEGFCFRRAQLQAVLCFG